MARDWLRGGNVVENKSRKADALLDGANEPGLRELGRLRTRVFQFLGTSIDGVPWRVLVAWRTTFGC